MKIKCILQAILFIAIYYWQIPLVFSQSPGALDPAALDTGTRVYEVLRGNNPYSELHISLSRYEVAGKNAFISQRRIRTPLGRIDQDVVFDAHSFRPIGAEGETQSRYTVDYIYHKGRVRGTITTPDSIVKPIDKRMPNGTLFPWMYEYYVALSPLDSGKIMKTPILHTDSDVIYTIEARVLGDTTITVPAGTFEVFPVRLGGRSPSTLYVRKEHPHINIKQTVDSMPVSIELETFPGSRKDSTATSR